MCDLLGDATVQVRGTAMESLVEIYRHVGVKVRMDLSKRDIPGPKLQQIFQKFDEIDKGENIQSGDEVNYFLVLEKITELFAAYLMNDLNIPNTSHIMIISRCDMKLLVNIDGLFLSCLLIFIKLFHTTSVEL